LWCAGLRHPQIDLPRRTAFPMQRTEQMLNRFKWTLIST